MKEGIGKKIEAKIEQYLSTGKIKKLEENRGDETGSYITQMTRIMGIGYECLRISFFLFLFKLFKTCSCK